MGLLFIFQHTPLATHRKFLPPTKKTDKKTTPIITGTQRLNLGQVITTESTEFTEKSSSALTSVLSVSSVVKRKF